MGQVHIISNGLMQEGHEYSILSTLLFVLSKLLFTKEHLSGIALHSFNSNAFFNSHFAIHNVLKRDMRIEYTSIISKNVPKLIMYVPPHSRLESRCINKVRFE